MQNPMFLALEAAPARQKNERIEAMLEANIEALKTLIDLLEADVAALGGTIDRPAVEAGFWKAYGK